MPEQLLEQLKPLISLFGDTPWIRSAVIVVFAILLAWIVQWFVTRGIRKLTARTRTTLDDQVVSLIHRPIFWSVVLIGILLAAIVAKVPQEVLAIARPAIITVLILFWMLFALRVSRLMVHALSSRGTDSSLVRTQTQPLFTNIAGVIIIGLAVYLVFQAWNIDMTAWLASAGIVGIAVGFAAKDTLANLFSGVFIMADSPYKIGDYVVLDQGERGKITHIGIRSTRMLTRDDVEVTVPNSIMGNTKIINESGGPHIKYRIRVRVGVAYGSDTDQVERILLQVARGEVRVCESPEPRVRFRTFGPSSLDYELLCWIEEPELRGRVLHHLNTAVYKTFNREGVEIPYSKHDLYIKELPAAGGEE
jgi:small-conductance mechanosensitive channel